MQSNDDLIGKTFHDSDDRHFEVTGQDEEFPAVLHFLDKQSGRTGCILAEFVRHNLD